MSDLAMPEDEFGSDPSGRMEFLPPAKSLELLATHDLGRVAFTNSALPVMHPVWYLVDSIGVVFRADLAAESMMNRVVGFQADDIDPDTGAGWTVTIVGHATPVTGAAQRAKLRHASLRTWTSAAHDLYVRITATLVAGHLLLAATTQTPADEPTPSSPDTGSAAPPTMNPWTGNQHRDGDLL